MNETIPTCWDDERDEPFFRITCHLLEAHWVEAASLLLLINDIELTST